MAIVIHTDKTGTATSLTDGIGDTALDWDNDNVWDGEQTWDGYFGSGYGLDDKTGTATSLTDTTKHGLLWNNSELWNGTQTWNGLLTT
jgi:hypothetical protein